jgi:hypothetical protein
MTQHSQAHATAHNQTHVTSKATRMTPEIMDDPPLQIYKEPP